MNGSQVVKRTLPLIIVLLIIIGIAISCTVLNKDKAVPAITNPESLYFEVGEGDRKFSMTNEEIYTQLKNSYGLSLLIEMIDINLLKSGETDYYNAVTNEEIAEAIEKDKFPESKYPKGKDALTEDEIEEAEEAFNESMLVNNGLKNQEEIEAFYRLKLARKKYATAQLEKKIQEADQLAKEDKKNEPYFTEKEYETQYKADYQNGYWAIIVPFRSEEEGYKLLKQLGITVHEKDTSVSGDFTKWVRKEGDEEVALTTAEVVQAFIDMYNAVNAHKLENYPNETLTLFKGVQYDIDENGKYTFNTDVASEEEDQRLNEFYYTYEEIVEYNSSIQNYLKVSMKNYVNYDKEEITSDQKFFTPQLKSYANNKLFVFMLKISEEVAPELDEVRDEVYKTLFEKELTETFIQEQIIKLREEQGFQIFDEALEKRYMESIASFDVEHKKTKAENKTLVAKVGETEYLADDLFDYMDKRFGMSIALNKINYFRLLNNPELNTIYDFYHSDLKEKERILDPERWQEIKTSIRNIRDNFLRNYFASAGYPATYGWRNFIKDYFGVQDENELKFFVLHNEIVSDFAEELSSVEDLDEDSALWKLYEEKMQQIVDEYFSSRGIHLLISVNDDFGNPIHPDEWTQYQKDLAMELFNEIWKYYESEGESVTDRLQKLADLFLDAPRFLAGVGQNVEDQPEGFDYTLETNYYKLEFAKYKSAGLVLKFENLGAGSPGKYVEPFEEALREIWKANPTSEEPTPYTDAETGEYKPIITEFGYHAYVNLSSTDISKWYYSSDEDQEEPGILPTLQMVKTYLKDSESTYLYDGTEDEDSDSEDEDNEDKEKFTSAMKTAVETYFNPVYEEISGSYYVTIQLYEELQGLDYTFNSKNYTEAQFKEFVQGRIDSYQSNLKYFGVEEE